MRLNNFLPSSLRPGLFRQGAWLFARQLSLRQYARQHNSAGLLMSTAGLFSSPATRPNKRMNLFGLVVSFSAVWPSISGPVSSAFGTSSVHTRGDINQVAYLQVCSYNSLYSIDRSKAGKYRDYVQDRDYADRTRRYTVLQKVRAKHHYRGD